MPYRRHLRAMESMAALDAFAYCLPRRERAAPSIEVWHG
jgi:hypothetical protein